MPSPGELVAQLEASPPLPSGRRERFVGYGVMSAPFASGHILAMRRFPATSMGPGYTSVWHYHPDGRWVFYQDQARTGGCSRYFGNALDHTVETAIDVVWIGPERFEVTIDGSPDLAWQVTLGSTLRTRALSRIGSLLPERWWTSPTVLGAMGTVASHALGAGKIELIGRSPNGQQFVANPKQIWTIPHSHAEVGGQDLGPIGPTKDQVRLGDFHVPTQGIFAIGEASFELET